MLSYGGSVQIQNKNKKQPTNPFVILELQNPSHDIPEVHTIHRSPDLEALKLRKGSSSSGE